MGADVRLYFCRHTQIGLLRLLSLEAVMGRGQALNQIKARGVYDRWLSDERVDFHTEPPELERSFRKFTRSTEPAPKAWADAYLAAFAAAGLSLVTLDRKLAARLPGAGLLE